MEAVISGTNPVCVTSNLFTITDTTQILAPPTCGGKKKKLGNCYNYWKMARKDSMN